MGLGNNKLVLLALAFIFLSAPVLGQAIEDSFSVLDDLGIVGSFQNYPQVWDAIVLIWIFTILGREVLGKQFSPKAGASIGAALAVISFAGFQAMGIVFVRDYGPWIAVGALFALLVFAVRLFNQRDGKSIGAFGVLVITSFLVYHEPWSNLLRSLNGLLFGIIVIAHVLSAVFAVTSIFRMFTSAGTAPDGSGAGGLFNSLGNAIGNMRDGARHIRDQIAPHETPSNADELVARINQFAQAVTQFQTQSQALINLIHPLGQNLTHARANPNRPQNLDAQVSSILNQIQEPMNSIVAEMQAIDQGQLNSIDEQHRNAFQQSSIMYAQRFSQIVQVLS